MKRRLLIGLIAVMAIICSFAFLTACGDDISDLTTLKDPVISGYDPVTGKVSWKFVDNADSYEVTFTEEGKDPAVSTVKTNSATYKTQSDTFDFTIVAKSNSIYSDSNTVSVTFVRLASDITLEVEEDGTVTWAAVDGATGYEVSVDNGAGTEVVDTSFAEVPAGKVHTVKVKPTKSDSPGTMYFSVWSSPVSVNKLKEVAISSITYKDGVIGWGSVASAAGYIVTVNSVSQEVTESRYTYAANGESFDVTVQAIGNHTSTYDSAVSAPKSFIYLAAVPSVRVENGVLTWDAIEGATGYQVKLNGANSTATTVKTPAVKLSAGTQYQVMVLPTATGENTVYFSDWSALTNISIFNSPVLRWSGVDVDGVDFVNAIQWEIINGASGYGYKLTLPDGSEDTGNLGADQNFFGHNFNAAGVYKFEVKALSEDENKYESAYSEPLTVTRLAAPTITTDRILSNNTQLSAGFTVTFDGVSGANGYTLYKSGTKLLTSNTASFKVTDVVEDSNTQGDSVAYYIQSNGKVNGKSIVLSSLSSNAQETQNSGFQIKVLPMPTDPTIEGKIYSFTGTTGDNGYNVRVSGNNHTALNYSLDLDNLLNAGTSTVSVCAMGNGHEVLASNYSIEISVQRLNAPTELTIATKEADGTLDFTGDNRASSYTAVITGQKDPLPVDKTTNISEYIQTTATVIVMYSIADRFYDDQHTVYYMSSKASTNYTFYKLQAPANVRFTNTQMLWNKPANLSSNSAYTPVYRIIDAITDQVENGEFAGTEFSLATLKGGNHYMYKIVAIGDGKTCINSDPVTTNRIYKLETPELKINTTDFQYEWNAVASSSGYSLSINGKMVSSELHEAGGKFDYKPTFEDIGSFAVVLTALGDNGTSTISSDECEYTQVVKMLTTPEFSYSYSADSYQVDGKITMNITKQTNCPNGYVYEVGGAQHYEKATTFSMVPNSSGAITLAVFARGGGFDANEVYYIDSQPTTTYTCNLLGYPSQDSITVNKDGMITWGEVKDALGYICKLTFTAKDGNSYTYNYTVNSNKASLSLSSFKITVDGVEKSFTYSDIVTMTLELQAKGAMKAGDAVSGSGKVNSAVVTKKWESNLH